MSLNAVSALGQIARITAAEVKQGDCIPDQNGFLHKVTSVRQMGNQVEIFLADMTIRNLQSAAHVFKIQMFGW